MLYNVAMFYLIGVLFVGITYWILRDLCRLGDILRGGLHFKFKINGTVIGDNLMLVMTDIQKLTVEASVKTVGGLPIEIKSINWTTSDVDFLDLTSADTNTVTVKAKGPVKADLSIKVTALVDVKGTDRTIEASIPVEVKQSDIIKLHLKVKVEDQPTDPVVVE